MFHNSDGKRDLVMTLLVIAFFVVTGAIILGMFGTVRLFKHEFTVQPLSAPVIASYFGVLLSGYLARRNGWGVKAAEKIDEQIEEIEDNDTGSSQPECNKPSADYPGPPKI